MEIDRLLSRLSYHDKSDEDELEMILSNRVDIGCVDGGMLSMKAIKKVSADIVKWHIRKNNHETK